MPNGVWVKVVARCFPGETGAGEGGEEQYPPPAAAPSLRAFTTWLARRAAGGPSDALERMLERIVQVGLKS